MSCEVSPSVRIAIGVTLAEFEHAKAWLQLEQGLAEPTRLLQRSCSRKAGDKKSDICCVSWVFGVSFPPPNHCVFVIAQRISGVAQRGMGEKYLRIERGKAQCTLGTAPRFGAVPHIAEGWTAAGPGEG